MNKSIFVACIKNDKDKIIIIIIMTVRPSVPPVMVFFSLLFSQFFFGCFQIISFILKSKTKKGVELI